MNEPSPPEADPVEPLQFENAEYVGTDTGRLSCTVCHREIGQTYYELLGKTVCEPCRGLVEGHMKGGSGLLRFARATLFGTVAAIAGALLYFGVVRITGYEIGLIAVVLGFMIGTAVRSGSRHRGGLAYQLLALFLTYSAIVASYVGLDLFMGQIEVAEANPPNEAAVQAVAAPKAAPEKLDLGARKPAPGPNSGEGQPEQVAAKPGDPAGALDDAANPEVPEQAQVEADANAEPELGGPLTLLLNLYAIPISAKTDSMIGLLIIGFALWEAWKLNRRVPLVFNGPFSIDDAGSPLPTELPSHA